MWVSSRTTGMSAAIGCGLLAGLMLMLDFGCPKGPGFDRAMTLNGANAKRRIH